MSKKLRVGVLMGGKSIEHEVSFNSGRTICDHLDTAYYDVIPLFQTSNGTLYILPWHFLHRGKITDFVYRLKKEAHVVIWDDLKYTVDFIYLALHGKHAEDGTIQAMLELLGIPYLGSKIRASALGMDKIMQKKFLALHGIKTPNSITLQPQQIAYYLKNKQALESLLLILEKQKLFFPLIVKPAYEGSSFGISVIHTKQELQASLKKACTIDNKKEQPILLEAYITGMEFSCIVITDKKTGQFRPLPPTEIVLEKGSTFFDYQQKYMPGRALKFTPARCSVQQIQKIQQTCIQVMQALEMNTIGRIDGFFIQETDQVYIIDPNTLSGAAPTTFPFRQAAEVNMSHTEFINHLIETELMNYNIPLDAPITQQSRKEKKLRVGVILGGKSAEKEIALESGRNVFYKLSPHKYQAQALFLNEQLELYKLNQSLLIRNNTQEIAADLRPEFQIKWADLPHYFDFIFIALHGGEGENGTIQGTLNTLDIPYNGSGVLTSSLCIDKYKTNNYLQYHGFDVPKSIFIQLYNNHKEQQKTVSLIEHNLSYPLVVKPHNDGCSTLVTKVTTKTELIQALQALIKANKTHALIEEFITGMELTVGIVGNDTPYALPPSHAKSNQAILSIEEKFLPGAGENETPAQLTTDAKKLIQETLTAAYSTVGCKGYARIDCFYQSIHESPTNKERIIIIEINTLPAMTPATVIFHQAAEVNIKPMDFIDVLIQLGLEEHQAKHSIRKIKKSSLLTKLINQKQVAVEH